MANPTSEAPQAAGTAPQDDTRLPTIFKVLAGVGLLYGGLALWGHSDPQRDFAMLGSVLQLILFLLFAIAAVRVYSMTMKANGDPQKIPVRLSLKMAGCFALVLLPHLVVFLTPKAERPSVTSRRTDQVLAELRQDAKELQRQLEATSESADAALAKVTEMLLESFAQARAEHIPELIKMLPEINEHDEFRQPFLDMIERVTGLETGVSGETRLSDEEIELVTLQVDEWQRQQSEPGA